MIVALASCAGASCDRGAEPDTGPFFTTPAEAPAVTAPDSGGVTRGGTLDAPSVTVPGNVDTPSVIMPAGVPSARDATVSPDDRTPPASEPGAGGAVPDDLARLSASLDVPVAGVARSSLRDTYSEARGDRVHEALDILAPRGTPVLSATDGRVLRLFDSRPGGLMVYATDASERFILFYGHLDGYAAGLRDGMALKRGQVIGYVGTTGNAPANTPHLHFGILRGRPDVSWSEGEPVNPYPLLRGASRIP